ncbi:RnfABCDGE type electron transport complex subunit G [Candidatus Galacturonibacter soehngenii]|uniref:Ion-translocating oxidoreductase complex subunit G n=1 Tax=Candidatus Galacturonatibacter soehngenii TaxID=2307010 RepID=A0A7V7QLN1_9FIRM|nr:RnfABCDGE type electron transport complex subunit G [Candidatus Galacturonibacter soehngenii]KAB1439434.1 RnfABCDGE type electron transport complex subunit G [Candidatus Galacturonibacter soehngenii]MBA4687298.1 RnfABCDGE type electron transport complex subunit G [Candidatus Galacturonibacter soehngenii]
MNTKIMKDAAMLTIITLIAGLLLGLVYEVTKNPIKVQQALTKQKSFQAVFQDATEFNKLDNFHKENAMQILSQAGYEQESIDEAVQALDANGTILGYVMQVTTSEGYGGDITFSMGIRLDGTVNGYEILRISETAGLGMKAKDASFKDQYANKNVDSFAYTKTGATAENEIDAISGATITTNAITNGVNAGIVYFNSIAKGGSK